MSSQSITPQDEGAQPSPGRPWPRPLARIASIGIATIIYPFVLWGAIQAWEGGKTRVEDWLPAEFAETQELIRFFESFGSDELLMVGWDTAQLGSPELESYRQALLRADPNDPGGRVFFSQAWTAQTVLDAMREPPLRLSSAQARRRMQGWILGGNDATAVIALVSADGMADRHAAVAHARAAAIAVTGRSLDQLHLAGPTIESVFIDESSQAALLQLNGFSLLACFLILIICVRHVGYAFVILMIAVYCEQAAMALIHYSGGRMDSVLLLTANLTLVLSISASIHMYGYYRHALARNDAAGPARPALAEALPPTSLAALTTAIGFGSLALASIIPIHNFGLYSAIAAPLGALLSIWYLAMYLPARRRTAAAVEWEQPTVNSEDSAFYSRWPWTLLLVGILLLAGGWGVRRLETTVGMHDLFPDDAKLVADYRWLEQRIGALVPIETVLELPVQEGRSIIDELRLVAQLQARLRQCESVQVVISALNFTPALPRESTQKSAGDIIARTVMERRLSQSLQQFESFRMLARAEDVHRWRLSARVPASQAIDYEAVMGDIGQAANESLGSMGVSDARVTISGGVPIAVATQKRLMADLVLSFFTALVLIGITMAVVLRSVPAGLLAVIPNLLPAVVVFGFMGWMGFKAELGSVMTASAVLGIAIDDSLHIIVAFRSLCRQGFSRQMAAIGAVRTCRAAVIHTSLVCGFGMLVFAASDFVPIQRFAWVMFTLLMVALMADLLLLPSILYSPLGRFFETNSAKRS